MIAKEEVAKPPEPQHVKDDVKHIVANISMDEHVGEERPGGEEEFVEVGMKRQPLLPMMAVAEQKYLEKSVELGDQIDARGDEDDLAGKVQLLVFEHRYVLIMRAMHCAWPCPENMLEVDATVMSPEHDEDEAEEHATEVRKVGDARSCACYAAGEFEQAIANDQPLGFERDGWDEEHDARIGEHHAEGQQDAEDAARCTDCNELIDRKMSATNDGYAAFDKLAIGEAGILKLDLVKHAADDAETPCCLLHDGGTDTTHEIVDQEAVLAPYLLEKAAEHVEREHVVEQMDESVVHEHVGDALPRMEEVGIVVMKTKPTVEVDALSLEYGRGKQHQHVDDDKMRGQGHALRTGRCISEHYKRCVKL